MIYAHINDEGLKFLEKELKSTKDAKWYKRLKIIQLSSQGKKFHNWLRNSMFVKPQFVTTSNDTTVVVLRHSSVKIAMVDHPRLS